MLGLQHPPGMGQALEPFLMQQRRAPVVRHEIPRAIGDERTHVREDGRPPERQMSLPDQVARGNRDNLLAAQRPYPIRWLAQRAIAIDASMKILCAPDKFRGTMSAARAAAAMARGVAR